MNDAITRIACALERIADAMAPASSPDAEAIAADNELMRAAAESLGRLSPDGMPIEHMLYGPPDDSTIVKLFKKSPGTIWRYPGGGIALGFDGKEYLTIDLDTGEKTLLK